MFAVPNNQKCPVKASKVYARKATRGNRNQRCPVYFDSKQCKIWQQRRAANWYYATVRTQKRSKYHSVLCRLTETTIEYESHSHWTEFRRNSSLVWVFYSGEKKTRVWPTHLSTISSNFLSAKEASSTAAPFSFLGCCHKRRIYRCGNKHFKSIAHTFSVRGKP